MCIATNAIGTGEPKKEFWGITKIYQLEDNEEYLQKPEKKKNQNGKMRTRKEYCV